MNNTNFYFLVSGFVAAKVDNQLGTGTVSVVATNESANIDSYALARFKMAIEQEAVTKLFPKDELTLPAEITDVTIQSISPLGEMSQDDFNKRVIDYVNKAEGKLQDESEK